MRMATEGISRKEGPALLPPKLRQVLWRRIVKCLQRGEVLITTEHFQKAMEREFRKVIHLSPTPRIRAALREMIIAVNEEHPETYLSLGIKNAVSRYLRDLEARLEGKPVEILEESRRRIRQMVREGRTAFFLESIGVEVGSAGVPASVERAIEKIASGETLKAMPLEERRARRRRLGIGRVALASLAAGSADEEEGPAQLGLPDKKEQLERIRKIKAFEQALSAEEMQRARRYLDSYVQQKLLDEEEAVTLRELYGIDERLARGEIDQAEAEALRSRIDAAIQERINQRLRAAVDYAVRYLNAFESLRRISPQRDNALRFLIRYQNLVMTEDEEEELIQVVERNQAIDELNRDEELLANLCQLLERRENEVRMISANLPPYRYLMSQDKLSQTAIEEGFVDELRTLSREEVSERLNAPDQEVRLKLAKAIRSLVELLYRVVEPTPFHRAVRRIKIKRTVAQLYRSSADSKSGRHKVHHFVNQRVLRLYPDLTEAERKAIDQESQEIMAAIDREREQKKANELRIYRA